MKEELIAQISNINEQGWPQRVIEDAGKKLAAINHNQKERVEKIIDILTDKFAGLNFMKVEPQDSYSFLELWLYKDSEFEVMTSPGEEGKSGVEAIFIEFSRYGDFFKVSKVISGEYGEKEYFPERDSNVLDIDELIELLTSKLSMIEFPPELWDAPYTYSEEYYKDRILTERLFGYY